MVGYVPYATFTEVKKKYVHIRKVIYKLEIKEGFHVISLNKKFKLTTLSPPEVSAAILLSTRWYSGQIHKLLPLPQLGVPLEKFNLSVAKMAIHSWSGSTAIRNGFLTFF